MLCSHFRETESPAAATLRREGKVIRSWGHDVFTFSLPWALALALPASAQALSFGVGAGAALPAGDLRSFDKNPGGTLGAFLDLDFGSGQVFRPRFDLVRLLRRTEDEAGTSYRRDFWGGSLGLDYDCYFSGSRKGLYGQVGAGLYHMVARTALTSGSLMEKTNQFGGSIGAGYDFNADWGVSFRYAYSTFKSPLPGQRSITDPTAGMVILSTNHRF